MAKKESAVKKGSRRKSSLLKSVAGRRIKSKLPEPKSPEEKPEEPALEKHEDRRAEEALRKSREDLNRTQAVARTGSWRLDVQRNELLWSDETHRIFGIPRETPLTYEAFLATVHPEDRQIVDQSWQAALRGEPYDIEHRILVEGKIKWVHERAELEFDKEGFLLGGFGTAQDITERKRSEQEGERLRVEAENERRRLEGVMEALPVGMAITDAKGGNLRANNFFEQIWGSPRPAAASVSDYVAYKACWADTGRPVQPEEWASARAVQKGETVVGQLFQIQRFDGTRGFVLNSAAPIFDADGQVTGSAVAIMDITAHREAEMKYSKILATALSGFWISDRQGRLLEVNDALCRISGYTREDLLTMSIADLEAGKSPGDVLNHIALLQQKKSDRFVSRHRRKDGSIIDVEANSTWLDIGEGQLVCFIRDNTERKRSEEALRKSFERYRSYIEVTGELGWTTNADGEVVEDVPSFRKFTGQTYEEVKGWGWSKALHPDDREHAAQTWRRAVKSKSNYEVEYRLRRHDGIYRYFMARGIPVFMENGSIQEWVGICIDITERKQMEEELRKSHNKLEIRVQERTRQVREQSRVLDFFFKFSTTPFVILDKGFNFIRVNEAYAKACHREVSEFPGHNHFEFYPSDAKAKFEQVVQTKTPYVAIARPFSFPDNPEWGISYWDWTLTPILDDTGEVESLVFSLEDVTERKRAEEALMAAHQYNRSLIEASLDPLVTIDSEGKVTDVNSATELATGVPREQLIGSDFSDYFTDPQKAKEGYEEVFSKGTVRDYPLSIRHTSGMITDVLYNATIYRNEAGGIQGIFAAARDITDRKRVEEALRESENRLRVLSSQLLTAQESERKRIAMELHDGIGQMLTAIKFKVESILQEKGAGKARAKEKSFETIIPMVRESVEEVRRMQMDLRPSTLDDLGVLATLGWFCREYQKIYSHIRIEKEIGLREDEVSNTLKTVIYRLTQEAMNNVAKHSEADFIHLSLRRMENEIQLVIKDNGMGFDLEEILSPERSKRGLGLSSMRERTELSGGTFTIESTRGKGTTVRANWRLSGEEIRG